MNFLAPEAPDADFAPRAAALRACGYPMPAANVLLPAALKCSGPDIDYARLERYPAEVPNGVGALVAAVDVQGDRLEAVVKGYGAGEESWLIAFTQLQGDPAEEATRDV